jgi:glutaredoxin 3
VKSNQARLDEMLAYSGGRRQVPVVVDDGKVSVGYGGT